MQTNIQDRKQIIDCLGTVVGKESMRRAAKMGQTEANEDTFGDDGCSNYLDCGGGFATLNVIKLLKLQL